MIGNFRNQSFFSILLLAVAVFTACSDSAPTNSAANSNARATTAASPAASVPANAVSSAPVNAAPSAVPAAGSPSATIVAFHQAMIKKDENAFRRTLSQATQREFLTEAKDEGKTSLLDYWTSISAPPPTPYQTRNERIAGDVATIEVRDPSSGEWTPTRLVRENNEWKLDYTLASSMSNMQNAQ